MLSAFIVVFGLLTFTMLLAEVVRARTIRRPSPPSWRATACVRAGHSALIEHERARGARRERAHPKARSEATSESLSGARLVSCAPVALGCAIARLDAEQINDIFQGRKLGADKGLRERLVDLMEVIEADDDGTVSPEEFILFNLKKMGKVDDETVGLLRDQFKALDADGSGELDRDDIAMLTKACDRFSLAPKTEAAAGHARASGSRLAGETTRTHGTSPSPSTVSFSRSDSPLPPSTAATGRASPPPAIHGSPPPHALTPAAADSPFLMGMLGQLGMQTGNEIEAHSVPATLQAVLAGQARMLKEMELQRSEMAAMQTGGRKQKEALAMLVNEVLTLRRIVVNDLAGKLGA